MRNLCKSFEIFKKFSNYSNINLFHKPKKTSIEETYKKVLYILCNYYISCMQGLIYHVNEFIDPLRTIPLHSINTSYNKKLCLASRSILMSINVNP